MPDGQRRSRHSERKPQTAWLIHPRLFASRLVAGLTHSVFFTLPGLASEEAIPAMAYRLAQLVMESAVFCVSAFEPSQESPMDRILHVFCEKFVANYENYLLTWIFS